MRTSELIDITLDWAAAKCWDVEVEYINDGITRCLLKVAPFTGIYAPSTKWSQGGPIIEREKITLDPFDDSPNWCATIPGYVYRVYGPTPLIAAMRCYCCAKLGDEIDIPEELQPCQQPNL